MNKERGVQVPCADPAAGLRGRPWARRGGHPLSPPRSSKPRPTRGLTGHPLDVAVAFSPPPPRLTLIAMVIKSSCCAY